MKKYVQVQIREEIKMLQQQLKDAGLPIEKVTE